jgi:hypothetical protein
LASKQVVSISISQYRATLARKWRDYESKKRKYLLSRQFGEIMTRKKNFNE